MKKHVAVVLLLLAVVALAYNSLRVQMRIFKVKGNTATIVLLRDSALNSTNAAEIVENLDYILWLTPGRDGKSTDGDFSILLDTLTEQAIDVMIAHLRQLTGRDLGADPKAWIAVYTNEVKTPSKQ